MFKTLEELENRGVKLKGKDVRGCEGKFMNYVFERGIVRDFLTM